MDNWNQVRFAELKDKKESARRRARTDDKMKKAKKFMKRRIKDMENNADNRRQLFSQYEISAHSSDFDS
jgi:hypothetical protein